MYFFMFLILLNFGWMVDLEIHIFEFFIVQKLCLQDLAFFDHLHILGTAGSASAVV